MAGGRPTQFTEVVKATILEHLRSGNYRDVASEAAGISKNTLAGWLTRGWREDDGPYREFLVALMEAERDAETRAVKYIAEHADPKNRQWWLERKYPQRWSKDREQLHELSRRIRELEARLGIGGGR